jgi:hypothetical protein
VISRRSPGLVRIAVVDAGPDPRAVSEYTQAGHGDQMVVAQPDVAQQRGAVAYVAYEGAGQRTVGLQDQFTRAASPHRLEDFVPRAIGDRSDRPRHR